MTKKTLTRDAMVSVFSHWDATLARIVRNALRAEGMTAEVVGERQGGFAGLFELQVVVPAQEARRARQLIESQRHRESQGTLPPRGRLRGRGANGLHHGMLGQRPARPALHQRSALPSFHQAQRVRTQSRRRGARYRPAAP
jgi:hypothetical protein